MLTRLSSSSTACLARRTSHSIQRLSSQARFNSSEAAVPLPASDADAAPKKRAIPIADSLGDISISNRSAQEGQSRNGNGDRRQNGFSNGNWNRDPNRPQRPRQNNFNQNGNGNGSGNQKQNRANAAGRNQNNADGQRGGQRPPRQYDQTRSAQSEDPAQQQMPREQRRPRQFRSRDQEDDDHQPFNIPAPRKIEFGNLDELFGTSAARTRAPGGVQIADGTKTLTPSEDRVQSLLERTAGDYSRYVPEPLPSTDVRDLSPLELGGFVLSKRRDVKLPARQSALAVVGKFPGTNAVVKVAETKAPSP